MGALDRPPRFERWTHHVSATGELETLSTERLVPDIIYIIGAAE
jgi:hypothetical protein